MSALKGQKLDLQIRRGRCAIQTAMHRLHLQHLRSQCGMGAGGLGDHLEPGMPKVSDFQPLLAPLSIWDTFPSVVETTFAASGQSAPS
jgi:hypothetical protein